MWWFCFDDALYSSRIIISSFPKEEEGLSCLLFSQFFPKKKDKKKNVPQCITIRTCIHLGFRIEWFFFSSLFFFLGKKELKNIIIIIIDIYIYIIADVCDEEEDQRDDDFDDDE